MVVKTEDEIPEHCIFSESFYIQHVDGTSNFDSIISMVLKSLLQLFAVAAKRRKSLLVTICSLLAYLTVSYRIQFFEIVAFVFYRSLLFGIIPIFTLMSRDAKLDFFEKKYFWKLISIIKWQKLWELVTITTLIPSKSSTSVTCFNTK